MLTGPNGAGKTTFLEAVAYLGTQRSFRGASREAMVRTGSDRAVVRAELDQARPAGPGGGRARHRRPVAGPGQPPAGPCPARPGRGGPGDRLLPRGPGRGPGRPGAPPGPRSTTRSGCSTRRRPAARRASTGSCASAPPCCARPVAADARGRDAPWTSGTSGWPRPAARGGAPERRWSTRSARRGGGVRRAWPVPTAVRTAETRSHHALAVTYRRSWAGDSAAALVGPRGPTTSGGR